MKWEKLLELLGDEPVFRFSLMLSGIEPVASVRRQLSFLFWSKSTAFRS